MKKIETSSFVPWGVGLEVLFILFDPLLQEYIISNWASPPQEQQQFSAGVTALALHCNPWFSLWADTADSPRLASPLALPLPEAIPSTHPLCLLPVNKQTNKQPALKKASFQSDFSECFPSHASPEPELCVHTSLNEQGCDKKHPAVSTGCSWQVLCVLQVSCLGSSQPWSSHSQDGAHCVSVTSHQHRQPKWASNSLSPTDRINNNYTSPAF